ncbi:IS4 family transposase [Butyrivibrio sp. TB]|uniref:IS4 family transposase n=1 Tax=Butyrivibrio sp. TB TaxID=1520809 RepID=UPI0008D0E0D7|nr:IS4 family transposase [Butyrivibrio sp. TB]SEQ70832.1 Transposase DDE domain-containing protein [Butyrivibrio sp. TB]
MSFALQVKDSLLNIISNMSKDAGKFSINPDKFFSRNRKLDFSSLIHLMLSMEAGTIKDELLNYFSFQVNTPTNSAFIQQRCKLSTDALPFLSHTFNDLYPYKLYKGKYLLLAADGSSFTFTRNPKDEESYFPPDGKTTNGYNQIHIIPLFELLSKRYTDCIVQPIRKKNEFQALCDLIDRHHYVPDQKPIFIADRGFHSFNVFAHAIEHNAYFLIRATDIKTQRLLGADYIFTEDGFDISINRILTRSQSKKKRQHPELPEQYKYICPEVKFDYITPSERSEYQLSLRVLRFKVSENIYENIITNLPVDKFSMEEIKYLYNLRWNVETSFRELKHVIGAANFHSKTRKYIEMEIWARLILYNFCSIITGHVTIIQKGGKHIYQVNYSVAYKACHYFLSLHAGEDPPDVENLIGKNLLPIRRDRKYARQHRFRNPSSFTYRFK